MSGGPAHPIGALLRRARRAAGLTQEALAAQAGVSVDTISVLERGRTRAPHQATLDLLAAALQVAPAERADWELATRGWRLPGAAVPPAAPTQAGHRPPLPVELPDHGALPQHDWGDAPAGPAVHGRARELETLARWVRDERCRVVAVLGLGGIGKTTVAARLAHDLASEFASVYWRSLRNAPPVEEWLAGAIAALSAGQAAPRRGSRRGSCWRWSCCAGSAGCSCWTTWKPSSSRAPTRPAIARATRATGRCWRGWGRAPTRAACC